jgi:aspartyl-tRNA(Asn)/glutamyl-tRNA(Gln) amidotransferase subunit C
VALTRDEVANVARLARLRLTDDEIAALRGDLAHILDAFETLQRLDTGDREPYTPLDDRLASLREDRADNPPASDDLLAAAPARHGRLFQVPKIIE